ncbi:hypothetical protein Glove_543g49 [Diversispora epigaea]|uniref:Protein kinase domain-containing protein n=1 Tax=Diversispora epigaea TaxID=1348612 RepID=A0A397GH17_9GLOM|nr:hypothetical protein Glove_543g49 [Diversispora epigaea]
MAAQWNEKLRSVWVKLEYSLDTSIYKTITEREEYRKNIIKNDSSLTKNEKKFLLNEILKLYDKLRIDNSSVEKQQCNNCLSWHQATRYCEFCIRKCLKNDFGNWTSGNNEIDKLIQECQETIAPNSVIKWIEYDQFENIKHFTEGGCATIYTAIWKDGHYKKWNSKKQKLERFGRQKIVLKRLNNSNSNNVHWFQEVILSFTLDNSFNLLARCYGLTKDPTTQDYMLILNYYDNDLRHFLKDDYHSLTLLQKYQIIDKVAKSLYKIHEQNTIHRDLHSGNILYYAKAFFWYVSDLGLSGPVDKPSNSIYGNLPYIAPEVLCGEIYTKKSDIYSLSIIMWEVITGETPLDDYEHDLELTLDIVKGCRPKIYEYIPHEYATLMKQCWDANPDNRPDAQTVCRKLISLIQSLYNETNKQKENIENIQSKNFKSKIQNFFKLKLKKDKNNQVIINPQLSKDTKSKIHRIQNSKVYTFNIPIKPRNATDEEQLAFDSKQIDFDSKQIDFEISEEMQQQYLKSIGANKSCDDQEFGIAGPSNSDFSELLNDKKEYNVVVIEVDQEENKKCFTAHSVVLRYPRKRYYERKSHQIIIKPKISAQIFEIILKYIYSGIVDNTDTKTIYELMINANELELKELSRKLEKYPTLIFESEDFTSIQETALISILKRDDLKVEEIKIWDYIIKWGIAQNPTLPTNLEKWSNENFKALKTILQQCLPLIRYFHISGKDIWKNVKPYKKILEEQLWDDLTQYFMFPNQPGKSLVLPARIISTPELLSRNISTPEFPFATSPNQKHNSLPTTTFNDAGNYMNVRQGNTQLLRMKQLPPPPYQQATPRTSQQVTLQLQSIGRGNTINKVQSNTYPNPLQNMNLPPSQLQPQNHPIFNNNFYVTGRIPILPSQQHQQQLMQQQHQQQLM